MLLTYIGIIGGLALAVLVGFQLYNAFLSKEDVTQWGMDGKPIMGGKPFPRKQYDEED